ncbi:hypothetical protein RFI_23926, partial [Reticulomyxa filosa]
MANVNNQKDHLQPRTSQSHTIESKDVMATEYDDSRSGLGARATPQLESNTQTEESPMPISVSSDPTNVISSNSAGDHTWADSEEDMDVESDSQWYYPPGHESRRLSAKQEKQQQRRAKLRGIKEEHEEEHYESTMISNNVSSTRTRHVSKRNFFEELDPSHNEKEEDPSPIDNEQQQQQQQQQHSEITTNHNTNTNANDNKENDDVSIASVPHRHRHRYPLQLDKIAVSSSSPTRHEPDVRVAFDNDATPSNTADEDLELLMERKEKLAKLRKRCQKVQRRLSSE